MPHAVPTHKPAHAVPHDRHRTYDRRKRNQESKAFYNSSAWVKLRLIKLRQDPCCERCLGQGIMEPATHVHHICEITEWPELRLEMLNLGSLCASCHSRHHAIAPHP